MDIQLFIWQDQLSNKMDHTYSKGSAKQAMPPEALNRGVLARAR